MVCSIIQSFLVATLPTRKGGGEEISTSGCTVSEDMEETADHNDFVEGNDTLLSVCTL